ncbi:MAG: 16S rRNA (adenine(1518)-N(6)/adenine(1519)-N(6))-dimethyltransferase RsmA [Acutalibacteraceae bacterium]|jgi:16S rRNA (adenine1518-N6/adenine1519-N6)-dimethyltransferase
MNLADINTIKSILKKEGFSFKKSLGQNFLIDSTVCPAMAENACDSNTGVLEIGPGIGVLTAELAKRAKKVVAIELDERLKKILPTTLAEFDNVEIIYGDVMKLDLDKIIREKFADCESVSVCANLPYYITSPIIMMLLEGRYSIKSITVMVQKEAAERLCARVGSKEAGAVTVAVNYYAKPEILFKVKSTSFMPAPKVDSAVIKLNIRETPAIEVSNEAKFFRLVKACFAQRRKTLLNTVSNNLGIDKTKLREVLSQLGLSDTVRGEELTMEQLTLLCDKI